MGEPLQVCLYCSGFVHCPHIADTAGKLIEQLVITDENAGSCPNWRPLTVQKGIVREAMYKKLGLGYLRCIHSELPDRETSLEKEEDENARYEMIMGLERPDFYAMLYEGITSTERDAQLRFQTDENGQVRVATGPDGTEFPLVRPQYELSGYAMDPNGPIKAGRNVMISNVNELIDHIIKAEVNLGLVTKVKKPKAQEAPQQEERETPDMPATKGTPVQTRVTQNRPAGVAPTPAGVRPPGPQPARRASPKPPGPAQAQAPAQAAPAPAPQGMPRPVAAGGGRVSNPVRRGGPPAPAQAQQAAAPAQVEASSIDEDSLAVKVANVVDARNAERFAELRGELVTAIERVLALILEGMNNHFDMAVQTQGTYQYPRTNEKGDYEADDQGNQIYDPLPLISRKKGGILSFTDGSAYTAPDEDGQPQGE